MKNLFLILTLLFNLFFSNIQADNLWHEFEKDQEILIEAILAHNHNEEENAYQEGVVENEDRLTFNDKYTNFYKRIRLQIYNKKLVFFDGVLIQTQQSCKQPFKGRIYVDSISPLFQDDVEKLIIENGRIEVTFKQKGELSKYTKITVTRLNEDLPAKMIYPIYSCSIVLSNFWKDEKGIWYEKQYHSIENLVLPNFPVSSHHIIWGP